MLDVYSQLQSLRRPRLLIRAARIGAQDYARERHLRRLLGYGSLPRSGAAVIQLIELERTMNDMRSNEDSGYSLTRHLDILIALIGEARLLASARPALND